jgi:hypothetical protein
VDLQQFVGLLVSSGLSNKNETAGFMASFQEECRKQNAPATIEAFCEFLIASGLFTAYQCGKL